jgi:hypothetical protein
MSSNAADGVNRGFLAGRSVQWFAQLAGDWNPRDLRDGGGFAELMSALLSLGAEPVETFSRLTRNDLLVLPTRPPLHDKGEGQPRRHLRPSSTALERAVHAPFELFFQRCARNAVSLAEEPARRLDPERKNRRSTTYYQYTRNGLEVTWAFYKTLDGRKPPNSRDRSTAVFLVHVPQLWKDGPGMLSAFGMGANETLLWCHLLRTRMRKMLVDVLHSTAPRFVMCELGTAAAWTSEPLRAPLDLLTLTAAWSPPLPETFAIAASRPGAGRGVLTRH